MSTCAAPDCGQPGKLKCSGCSAVSYCSPVCQKKHWSAHKQTCKTSCNKNSSAASLSPVASSNDLAAKPEAEKSELEKKFDAIQAETQRMFVSGDFPGSIKSGQSALELAKQLPPQKANTEIVQIQLNTSTAFMQLQKFEEAMTHAALAVTEAENGIKLRPGQPQAIEVLAITLGTQSFSLLNMNKTEEAAVAAERSLQLAEAIYPKADPRLFKPLRTLGQVREKQGKDEEAEKLYVRSYTILSLSVGPHSPEAQMSVDELVNFHIKRKDHVKAEQYARNNFKSVYEKTNLDERGELIKSDSASRLAIVLRNQGKLVEAEELMEKALSIREEKLSRVGQNPIGIAYTLSQLASIQEAQGKLGADVEGKLMKALDIFGRTKGQNSPEVQSCLNQLRNVRMKRAAATGGAPPSDGADDSGLTYSVSDAKGRIAANAAPSAVPGAAPTMSGARNPTLTSTGSRSNLTTTAAPTAGSSAVDAGLTTTEEIARLKLTPEDGMGRMMAANGFFESGKFSCAEAVLAEALAIFMRTKGPNDQMTQAAKQNLGVARGNALNRLWMQVVTQIVLEQADEKTPKEAAGKTDSKSNSGNAVADEYAALMAGKKGGNASLEESMLFGDSKASKGGCVIC